MKILVVVATLLVGCASAKSDDGGDQPRASHEVVSGAGRIRGGGMRMDVSVGHTFAQRPVKAGGTKVQSASPVVP